MFRSRTAARTVAALGAAALVLGACTDDRPALDFTGTLELGVLVPQTGPLEFLAPAQTAAVELAVADINDAGGVWGTPVTVQFADEGDPDDPEVVQASAQTLIDAGVQAVVGPLATTSALSVIESFQQAQIIQVSPASPGVALDDHPARGYYFRVHPPDTLQGRVIAEQLVNDGRERVAIIARDDAYGQGIAALVREVYEGDDQRTLAAEVSYDPEADLADPVAEVVEAEPDAVVIISFEEAVEIMTALADEGLSPADETGWYLAHGNLEDYSDDLPEGTMTGAKGTAPISAVDLTDFRRRLDTHAGDLDEYGYAAEAYDAVVLLALGAVVANSDDPDAIRAAMVSISGDPGDPCASFRECMELIRDGKEINYVGESGPVDWTEAGDPRQGAFGVYEYDANNTFTLQGYGVGRL